MEKRKITSIIIFIFLILLVCLLVICVSMLNIVENENNIAIGNTVTDAVTDGNIDNIQKELTIKDIVEKYGSVYINEIDVTVYLEFAKMLYTDNGDSNEKYFVNMVNDLAQFFEPDDFYLIDNKNEIYIYAKYNSETKSYELVINEIENFYSKIDGEKYVKVDTSQIIQGHNIAFNDIYLNLLIINDFYHRSIASRLGEAVELDNGYLSYLDGAIKIRKLVTDGVRNIVFSDDYEGYITLYIKPGMSLKEILEHHPENTLGSVNKGYLGYRTADFYLFCYEDEFSLYPYSYRSNKTFEEILEKYLDDGDFTSFISNLSTRWMAYDYMEVDLENKNADILYSTRGVHIKIENGDPSKTTFYSNYCFTDYTKHLVKNGILDFEPGVDLVEKTELERRKMID